MPGTSEAASRVVDDEENCGSPVQKLAQSKYFHGWDDRIILINEFDREPIRILNEGICLAS